MTKTNENDRANSEKKKSICWEHREHAMYNVCYTHLNYISRLVTNIFDNKRFQQSVAEKINQKNAQ